MSARSSQEPDDTTLRAQDDIADVILSARMAGHAHPGETFEIVVVFAETLEASTLRSEVFALVGRDGRPLALERVSLRPGRELGEHRSVAIEARSGSDQPLSVFVSGPLYSASGRSLRGASAPVERSSAPIRLVYAETYAADERSPDLCPRGARVVRTFWSDIVLVDRDKVLSGVRVRLASGSEVPAIEVADVEDDESFAPEQDNVLEFCFAVQGEIRAITVDTAALSDRFRRPCARHTVNLSQISPVEP